MIDILIPKQSRKLPVKKSFGLLLFSTCLLSGCSLLLPTDVTQPKLYSLDDAQPVAQHTQTMKPGAPTLIIGTPRAAAGFDSAEMVYMRQPHKLEYFRENQWINAPAVMLSPLVATALEKSGAFGAVVQSPTSVSGQFRLELEVIRLQQEFISVPSREHFTLRAHLLNPATRQVVAWREFDASVPAASDDPYGGVMAANQAVRTVIAELAVFCADAIAALPQSRP
ncbi:MAG TPA: ABC-type transport auxiliary lipoprotein family protein [Burkholderiaceae bacterium]|jgi:cholesterol transport system auxiliary component